MHGNSNKKLDYSSTPSLTSALDGLGWSTPHPGRFTAGKDPVPIVKEAGWAPGPFWTGAENFASTRIRSPELPTRSKSLYRLHCPGPQSLYRLHCPGPQLFIVLKCKTLQRCLCIETLNINIAFHSGLWFSKRTGSLGS